MSYRALSALAALVGMGVVYGGYFFWAAAPGHSVGQVLGHMIGACVLLTLILIVLETAIALRAVSTGGGGRQDERDALNGLRSARNGFYALMGLAWIAPVAALAGAGPVLLANFFLALMVAGEAVHCGSRVVYDQLAA